MNIVAVSSCRRAGSRGRGAIGLLVVPDQTGRWRDVYAEAIVRGSVTVVVLVLTQPVSLAFRFVDVLGLHGGAQPEVGRKTTANKPRPI